MAADLDYRNDGKGAAMFSVKETPWHREGTVFDGAPSVDEALQAGGLDFTVEVEPLYRKGGAVVPGAFATVRTDRNEVLGVVGHRYTPLQNRDAFKILEPLLDSGLATLETGGSLRAGRDVWLMVRFNIDSPVVQEVFADEIVPFGMISNNHAGKRQVVIQETPIRVVCANTLGMALSRARKNQDRAIRVRHTTTVEARTVDAARNLWAGLVERYEMIARQYQTLKASYLDEAMFRKLVLDSISPLPAVAKLDKAERNGFNELSIRRAEERRERLMFLWHNGDGHTGDNSAWEAYNAVAQSVDHDEDHWKVVRGVPRTQALYDGRLARIKQQALDVLFRYASNDVALSA